VNQGLTDAKTNGRKSSDTAPLKELTSKTIQILIVYFIKQTISYQPLKVITLLKQLNTICTSIYLQI
jgi:hypothetical protein